MTLSTSSSAYSLPSSSAGGYNLRAATAAAQNAPPLGSGNFPNPIEKRVKLAHSHPERSLTSKVQVHMNYNINITNQYLHFDDFILS